MPDDASGAIDLNTMPQIAIGNIEVITGGASAVYGADALAGVTNIKLRNNFEGAEVRARGGINEASGDGKEWQFSTHPGRAALVMAGATPWWPWTTASARSRCGRIAHSSAKSWSRRCRNPGTTCSRGTRAYQPGTAPCNALTCTTTSLAATAGGGANNVFNRASGNAAWAGNGPTQTIINQVFADRTCGTATCITNAGQGTYYFNSDGTLFTTTSTAGAGAASLRYGPQSFNGTLGGTEASPDETRCVYTTQAGTNTVTTNGFQQACIPTLSRVDYGRRLTSPRESYTLLGNAEFAVNDHITAYSTISFARSQTETRREPSPASGNWGIAIPFTSNGATVYLPSVAQFTANGINRGDTLPEFRAGGKRGTNCGPTGGCTMAQAFPLKGDVLNAAGQVVTAGELRRLLANRPDVTLNNASSAFNGMSVCDLHVVGTTVQVDPNTGGNFKICGPDSAWRLTNQLGYLPPRGTFNTVNNFQLFAGLKGDLGLKDWTWDAYISEGESRTLTEYKGYVSSANYAAIISAPNYGQGFTASSNVSNKTFTCTSGLDPFKQAAGTLQVSQDCINAITSNQADKQAMQQYESQLNLQGGLFDLPAGQVRSAVGVSWRKNNYYFRPDSLRESESIFDGPMGQFGVANIDGTVSVKEVYGELLVPLLKDLPAVQNLELELGFRHSKYSTGQSVPTYKAQVSWTPIDWVRVRGGYNRAERTPNIAELYTLPTTSSQLSTGLDPCSTGNGATLPNSNSTLNTNAANLAALRLLCSNQINLYGGNNASNFHTNPNFTSAPAVVTFRGDPNLKSEKGDTWTAGVVLQSPFDHALLQRTTMTIDWYSIRIKDALTVQSSQFVLNACFNQDGSAGASYGDGSNPTYSLSDPGGFCSLIEPSWLKHASSTNCEDWTVSASLIRIEYQSIVIVVRCSSAWSNGDSGPRPPSRYYRLFSLFRFGSPRNVTTAGADVKLGFVWKFDAFCTAIQVDLVRAQQSQRSQVRGIGVEGGVGVGQRRSIAGAARIQSRGQLRAGGRQRVQLGDIRRAFRPVVPAADADPVNRRPAYLRLIGGHALAGGILRNGGNPVPAPGSARPADLQQGHQQLAVDFLNRDGAIDIGHTELPHRSIKDRTDLSQRVRPEVVVVLAPGHAHGGAHLARGQVEQASLQVQLRLILLHGLFVGLIRCDGVDAVLRHLQRAGRLLEWIEAAGAGEGLVRHVAAGREALAVVRRRNDGGIVGRGHIALVFRSACATHLLKYRHPRSHP